MKTYELRSPEDIAALTEEWGLSALFRRGNSRLFRRGVLPTGAVVFRRRGWPMGMERACCPKRTLRIWEILRRQGRLYQPGVASRLCQFP